MDNSIIRLAASASKADYASRGVLPCISQIGMCHPKRYGFCVHFGLKTGREFAHFGQESGNGFWRELWECVKVFVVSIQNENKNKKVIC